MEIKRSNKFERAYKNLPENIKKKAQRQFGYFVQNPWHPSLHTKKIRGVQYIFEGRIDGFYRFTFHFEGSGRCVLRNIGPHDIVGFET